MQRPEIYLEPNVRAGISAFALADNVVVEKGINLLAEDLKSGQWDIKYGDVKKMAEIDVGYGFLQAKL